MKETESNQDVCNLDMPQGLHGIDYPQKFVRAPLSEHPNKAPDNGKKCDSKKIMSETLHAK